MTTEQTLTWETGLQGAQAQEAAGTWMHPHSRHTSLLHSPALCGRRAVCDNSSAAPGRCRGAWRSSPELLLSQTFPHQPPASWQWVLWPSSSGVPTGTRAAHSSVPGATQRWAWQKAELGDRSSEPLAGWGGILHTFTCPGPRGHLQIQKCSLP